jgi:phosphoserine phosphatase
MSKHIIALCVLVGAAACGDDGLQPTPDAPEQLPDAAVDSPPMAKCQPKSLRTDLTWAATNRADVNAWLAAKGCNSPGYDETKKPVALFDWDNTVSKNDFGDAITFYMIKGGKVLQPPNQDWKLTSGYMTDAGAAALTAACGTTVAAGSPLPTNTNTACADEMLSMYIDNVTTGGQTAFAGHNYRTMEPTYAWTAQLMAGYTDAEVAQFATAAITPQLAAAENTTQVVGTRTVNGWLRLYDQTKDVIDVAKSQGYDVWVITASPQPVIAAFAPMAGVAADHVIGIRSMHDADGKRTYKFRGCGNVADDNQSMISYIAGKRCWVNKVIWGDNTAKAMLRRPDGERQVFGAGDSDTDIEFLRDATYRLVIDRNKTEIMCNAFYNANDTWRVNPMFIQPRAKKTSAYPCSTTGFKSEGGAGVPLRDDANNVVGDQLEP